MADLGQVGGRRYTVNDNSVNVWTQDMASRFGVPLAAAAAGGTSFATGNARVIAKPDAAGSAATPTVAEQIDGFLAAGSIGVNDLMVVSAGTADIVAEMAKVTAGAQTGEQMIANVGQAGRDLAAQVRRLVQAGGDARGGLRPVQPGPVSLGHGHRAERLAAASQHQVQRGVAGGSGGPGQKRALCRCGAVFQPDGSRTPPDTTSRT